MILKVNSMYEAGGARLIPRSHFKTEKGVQYAIFERLVKNGTGYAVRHITLTRAEIKKAMGIAKNEKVEIL